MFSLFCSSRRSYAPRDCANTPLVFIRSTLERQDNSSVLRVFVERILPYTLRYAQQCNQRTFPTFGPYPVVYDVVGRSSGVTSINECFPLSARTRCQDGMLWGAISGVTMIDQRPKRQFKKRHIPTGGVRPSHADIERNKFF